MERAAFADLGADGKPALERDPESKASQEVARLFSWLCEQVGLASSSIEDARQQSSKMSQAALKVQLAALALAEYAGEGQLAELGPGFHREDCNLRYANDFLRETEGRRALAQLGQHRADLGVDLGDIVRHQTRQPRAVRQVYEVDFGPP